MKTPDHAEEALLAALSARGTDIDGAIESILELKAAMNEMGWWMSLRDRGDGRRVDCCWFWKKDWRRTGMDNALLGDEWKAVHGAAIQALKAPVPEEAA